jgi:hypothetical protein
MQWSKTIMAFLILFFSLSPCAEAWEADNCSNENRIHAQAEPINSPQEADTCTPFCACACCHIPLSSVYFFLEIPESDPPVDFLVEVSGSVTPPHVEIWQPPKI